MAETQPVADPLAQMLTEVALSTARLRVMADEAHALVELLQNRPSIVSVKQWTTETNRPAKR